MKLISLLLLVVIISYNGIAQAEVYMYRDGNGRIHGVSSIDDVPQEYREQCEQIGEKSGYQTEENQDITTPRGLINSLTGIENDGFEQLAKDDVIKWHDRAIRMIKYIESDNNYSIKQKNEFVDILSDYCRKLEKVYSQIVSSEKIKDEKRVAEKELQESIDKANDEERKKKYIEDQISRITISDKSVTRSESGSFLYIRGKVYNGSDHDLRFLKVVAVCQTWNEKVVDVDYSYVEPNFLPSRSEGYFEIMVEYNQKIDLDNIDLKLEF